MSLTDSRFTAEQRQALLDLARASIRHGLNQGSPLKVDIQTCDPVLQGPGAAFVTLHRNGELRGCIGSLEAWRPLVTDVAENAFAAAFHDPRFPRLQDNEFDNLDIHLSILSPSEPIHFSDQTDLIRQLRPGVDGLVLEDGPRRGTFLPSVWEQLPEPEQFLAHLKLKAGLPADYWSDQLQISRYTAESIESADNVGEKENI